MPVKKVNKLDHGRADLVDAIWRELDEQHPLQVTADSPDIREQLIRPGQRVMIAVVWTKWRDVEAALRPQIILDAYERRFGEDKLREIALAVGLTPEESSGLQF